MTDNTPTLGSYGTRPIMGTAIAVRGIGGGLDDPLAIEPEVVPIGGHRMLCIPVVCVDHQYPVEDRKNPEEGGVTLTHIFKGDGPLFFVDPTVVDQARGEHQTKVMLAQKAIADAKDRAEKAKKGTGAQSVELEQGVLAVDKDALVQAHLVGDHAALLEPGCPECEWEIEAEKREALLEAEGRGELG